MIEGYPNHKLMANGLVCWQRSQIIGRLSWFKPPKRQKWAEWTLFESPEGTTPARLEHLYIFPRAPRGIAMVSHLLKQWNSADACIEQKWPSFFNMMFLRAQDLFSKFYDPSEALRERTCCRGRFQRELLRGTQTTDWKPLKYLARSLHDY